MSKLKKLLIFFGLLCLAAETHAVTVNLLPFDGSQPTTTQQFIFSPGVNMSLEPGGAIDSKVAFSIFFSGAGSQTSTAAGAFSLELDLFGNRIVGVDNISAKLMGGTLGASGVDLDTAQTSAGVALSYAGLLGAGNYMLTFSGDVPQSYTGGGSITGSVSVASVPIPAAVWLFGGAIIGLIGLNNRVANSRTA